MATYRVPYSEEYYGYIYFEADSLEEAEAIVEEAEGNWDVLEETPGYFQKVKGGGWEIHPSEIEEIG